jgi:hypothetical protein
VAYRVEIAEPAAKSIAKLHSQVALRVRKAILGLAGELLEALDDLNDIEAVARFREHPEPTMEAGEFFARLDADQAKRAG